MLPGVTAGGAEGEAPSPARPGSPTSLGPQSTRRTTGAARGGRKTSSGSFSLSPLHPSCRPHGEDAAAVVPGPAGSAVHGAGEMWGRSKTPEPLSQPPGEPPGLCGTWSIPRISANGGGQRLPALGGAVKAGNEAKELLDGMGTSIPR